jgi:hypothetical protein
MRNFSSLLALALLGCSTLKTNSDYRARKSDSAVVLAVSPLSDETQERGFTSGFGEPGRVQLLSTTKVRRIVDADEGLHHVLSGLGHATFMWQRRQGLVDRLGTRSLQDLRAALAPADLLLVPVELSVARGAMHTLKGDFTYRVYDLKDGSFILEDEQVVKVDTDPAFSLDQWDERAELNVMGQFGAAVRKELEESAVAHP